MVRQKNTPPSLIMFSFSHFILFHSLQLLFFSLSLSHSLSHVMKRDSPIPYSIWRKSIYKEQQKWKISPQICYRQTGSVHYYLLNSKFHEVCIDTDNLIVPNTLSSKVPSLFTEMQPKLRTNKYFSKLV